MSKESEECEACGGDGFVEQDRFHGDHYTISVRCPECDGAGRVDDDGPDFADECEAPLPTEDTTGLKDPPQ